MGSANGTDALPVLPVAEGRIPSFLKPSDGCCSVPLPSWTEPESSGHPTLHLHCSLKPHVLTPGVGAVAIPVAAASQGRELAQALGSQPQRAYHCPLPGAGLPCPRRDKGASPQDCLGQRVGAPVPFPEGGRRPQ